MLRQAAKLSVNNVRHFNTINSTSVLRAVASRSFATSSIRAAIDGNEAAARSAYLAADTAMIFPITPSSPMGEHCDAWATAGKKNLFNETVSVHELQSEAGAIGSLHGALIGGLLGTTFSSSQGLLLMYPNMLKIAGELLPAVIHVASRSVTKVGGCLYGDHSDVMTMRNTGFAFLSSHNVQEAHDLAMVSHIAAINSSIPFLHFFDGFRVSHNVSSIELLPEDKVRTIFPYEKALYHKNRGLNPTHPNHTGMIQGGDMWMQANQAAQPFYDAVPKHVQNAMDAVASISGRQYHLYDYVGAKDAERVIILMGSGAQTAEETVNYLNKMGEKVGVIKVHLFRPVSSEYFMKALPASCKKVAVLDRVLEESAIGGPLYQDVVGIMNDVEKDIKVVGGAYGVGGKEFTPSMIKAVFDNLNLSKPKNKFTVGINDDVCHSSLPLGPNLDTLPSSTKQCILYGLGSDGTVGASQEAIKLISENTTLNAQGYFVFDAHKSGGLTVSHLRFGPEKITAEYGIQHADYIGCHLSSYVHKYDLLKNIKQGGTFVLNAPWKTVEELNANLPNNLKKTIAEKHLKFYTIDATKVAQEVGLRQRINMVMQAVFFKLSNVLPQEKASDLLAANIKKRYYKKGQSVIDMNIKAMQEAGDRLVEITYPESWASLDKKPLRVFPSSVPEYYKDIMYPTLLLEGDDLPVSKMIPGGRHVSETSKYEKRGFANIVPIWNSETCTQCNTCSIMCPHSVIRPFLLDSNEVKNAPKTLQHINAMGDEFEGLQYSLQASVLDCTGCEVCANACPTKSLTMTSLSEVSDRESSQWDYLMTIKNKGNLTDKYTVRGSQFQAPMTEFNGACAGCGEPQYVKLLTQLLGDRLVIPNAMGCAMVCQGLFGSVPFTKNEYGQGPAWGCSLFEDNAEWGLGLHKAHVLNRAKLETNIHNALNDQSVKMSPELKQTLESWLANKQDGDACRDIHHTATRLLETEKNNSPALKAVYDYLDVMPKVSTWVLGGDGWAYDIGFGGLDHVLASGQNVKVLVLDTEMYANTGGQASKATQMGAVAKFAAGGKPLMKKDLGKIAMGYKNVYVASIAIGADMKQTVKALSEADSYDGPAIVLAYTPCQQHGYPSNLGMSKLVDVTKQAVQTGYWPLYRYDPRRATEGKNPFQLDFKKVKGDVKAYLANQNRYQILMRNNPEVAKKLQEQLETELRSRHEERLRMAMTDKELLKYLDKSNKPAAKKPSGPSATKPTAPLETEQTNALSRDMSQCIDCKACEMACKNGPGCILFGLNILRDTPFQEGPPVLPVNGLPLKDTKCISCGQCAVSCGTGAIVENSHIEKVKAAMKAGKTVVIQTAPATRVAIAEEFDEPAGTIGTKKMVGGLKKLGFNYVFDTNWGADLTIMEEGTELLNRLANKSTSKFPMFTSCCPGWVNLVEKVYPEFIPNLSSCRSPHMMLGATVKSYWAQKNNLKKENVYVVSLMPCTAKKDEIERSQMWDGGEHCVDAVLTTRELGTMLKEAGVKKWSDLQEAEFDNPLGSSSGAGDIFGSSGGVMEAALRTAYEVSTGKKLDKVDFKAARGLEGVKEFSVDMNGNEVKCAVVHSKNIHGFLDKVKKGEAQYDFVEVMACPGGCINGGGQPRSRDKKAVTKRMEAIYEIDSGKKIRKSHENPDIQTIYKEFFEKPNSHKAHDLLHTTYKQQPISPFA
ncbi:hypothetical protein WA158_003231 [Blastocystis sp. Blastoise]